MTDAFENEVVHLPDEDVAYLREVLGSLLERREHGWALRRVVGQFQLPSGGQLRIRSRKSSSANLFSWMMYVDPALRPMKILDYLKDSVDHGDIAALVAVLFARTTLAAFQKHGLRRNYLRVRVQTSIIRGRIDFAEALRRGGTGPRVPCMVWDRLPDTPLNRLLSEAVHRLRSVPHLRNSAPRELAEIQGILTGVTRSIDPDLLLGRRPLSRTELPFETPCALARLVIRSSSLSAGSRQTGVAFFVNLEELFERAVTRAFEESGLPVWVQEQVPYHADIPGVGVQNRAMAMDVYLPATPVGPIVVDAKFKSKLSSGNLQQVVTYCFVRGSSRAVLVYPAGHLEEHAAYYFAPPRGKGSPIRVDTAELRTDGSDVTEWQNNGRALVRSVVAPSFETAVSVHAPRPDVSEVR